MTVLYDLADAYRRLVEVEEEEERDLSDVLGELRDDINEKVENCCRVIRQMELEATGFQAEIERLTARKQARDNRARAIKDYLKQNLETAGLDKVKGQLFTAALQASPPSCQVLDEGQIPELYKRVVTTVQIDKAKIIQEWRANREVPGAQVSQGKHLRIR